MSRLAAFTAGAIAAVVGVYIAWTLIEHQRNFDNQEFPD